MMTSLNDDDLLAAVGAAHADPGYQPSPASPEASAMLARILSQQHQGLRRRRARSLGAVMAAAAVAIALIPLFAKSSAPDRPAAVPFPAHQTGTGVRLVAYTGAPHAYYRVQKIPAGWVVQGTIPEDLVIAPQNDPDKDPNSFVGKLFVGMQLIGGLPGATRVSVNGHIAWYRPANSGDSTQMLEVQYVHGWWLIVQAPGGLGWNMDQLIRFAAGVTVLPGARPGAG